MKNIKSATLLLLGLLYVHLSFAQAQEPRQFSPGDQLPLGNKAVAHAFANIHTITVRATDESGRDNWEDSVVSPQGYNSVEEFKEAVSSFRVSLHQIDPRDVIYINAECTDVDGNVMLVAGTSIRLDKQIGEDGQVRYVAPNLAGQLWFYLESIPFVFDDSIDDAYFEYEYEGQTYRSDLRFENRKLWIPGWIFWQSNGTIRIDFDEAGNIAYDIQGDQIVPQTTVIETHLSGISGLDTFEMTGTFFTHRQYPQSGIVPVLEITPTRVGIHSFNFWSGNYGDKIVVVKVNTSAGIRAGLEWQPLEKDANGNYPVCVGELKAFYISVEWYNPHKTGGEKG